ncbi:ATP-dependent zinc metalloprotease FtsH [Membranihabitans maritimus]|uniref:ATP-dependent zinc metalloprotease FtsH n=1 Tax=Membranihabitans maritimus TaxID=2904244 RepID=UPI001EFFA6DF|nr:ATP-dependent zinc metalloprotease FtsH [Membranihabitans maritimus]
MDNNKNNKKNSNNKKGNKFNIYWIYGIIILLLLFFNIIGSGFGGGQEIDYKKFKSLAENGDINRLEIVNKSEAKVFIKKSRLDSEEFKDISQDAFSLNQPHYTFNIGTVDALETRLEKINSELAEENQLYPVYKTEYSWTSALTYIIPIVLIIAIWIFIMRRMSGGAGGPGAQIFNIGKSKATLFDKDTKVNVTFQDVAGLDEAKEEVMEVVDFLKNPKKYTSLGGKIPKGVLLVGPPGTGKTLLAKAVAGEAEVPFFTISGSDFVEMFVGVGASRVRDLFRQAREKAPCIIFIDEIDAIGRARGRNSIQGGNDERENTLNQLLVEMDGFSSEKGVILMAATNRPDVLDTALLRPGRFDRQIGIDRPDLNGREQIFEVHLKHIKVSVDVNAEVLAEMTPGFAGAEIANVCNEAALIAARRDKKKVDMEDFNYALDKVIGGLEKKNKLISPSEKKVIAYHEAGHAICGWFLEHASPLVKVTIVPRGIGTLGYAQYLPKEEYITSTEQLLDRMCMTFGGRAAESIIFGKVSTGAQNDLDQITKMAYSMIAIYGMNDNVGNISFHGLQKDQINKPYSEETSALIDSEVRKMVQFQFERAKALLTDKREELEILAKALLEREVVVKSDLEELIGPRPFPEPEKLKNDEVSVTSEDENTSVE